MPDVDRERRVVAALYPSQSWKDRVAAMPDHEVLAIYVRKRKEPTWNVLRAGEQEALKPSPSSDPSA